MLPSLSHLLFVGAVVDAAAISSSSSSLNPRTVLTTTTVSTATLPIGSANTTARAEAIEVKREGWGYGPSKLGVTSFYPNGTLGDARSESDQAGFLILEDEIEELASNDLVLVEEALVNFTFTCADIIYLTRYAGRRHHYHRRLQSALRRSMVDIST